MQVESIQEIVFVSQREPLVQVFRRPAAGLWTIAVHADLAGELLLESVPVRLPLADLYRDVVFPPPPPPAPEPEAPR